MLRDEEMARALAVAIEDSSSDYESDVSEEELKIEGLAQDRDNYNVYE